MKQLRIRVADLSISIQYRYEHFERQCEGWLDQTQSKPDLQIITTDEDIEKECGRFSEQVVSKELCESICIYREIAKRLGEFSAFVMHGAVLELDHRAYMFTAPSGVGKTTHTRLWLEHFGEQASYINGDKPILRCIDGVWYAYGTPWMGKERYGAPKRAPIQAICFIERGEKNEIHRMEAKEVVSRIFSQLFRLTERNTAMLTLDLIDDIIRRIPFYLMKCTISEEAVQMAYEAMKGGENHEI